LSLQGSQENTLHVLEQARFVTELIDVHGMTVAEVAHTLAQSKAWVPMRRSLWSEMTECHLSTASDRHVDA
jgi:hypothetical protein